MTLVAGGRLGPYEVSRWAGGMRSVLTYMLAYKP